MEGIDKTEEFFRRTTDYKLESTFYECRQTFTVEEMYQAFKERLLRELKEERDD